MLAITTVYGKPFIDLFLKITLRSLSQKNNLAEKSFRLTWIIVTTKNGQKQIEASEYFKKIKKTKKIIFKYINQPLKSDKYEIMTAGHNLAFELAEKTSDGILFLQPDAIYFDGFMKLIVRNKNKKAIFLPSYMVVREQFVKIFKNERRFSIRKVVDETINNLHPYTKDHFINSDSFRNDCPNFFFDRTSKEEITIAPPQLGLAYFLPDFSKKYILDKNYDEYLLEEVGQNIDNSLFLNEISKGIWPEMSPLKRFSKKVSKERFNFIWVISNWKSAPYLGPSAIRKKLLNMNSVLSTKTSGDTDFLRLNIICNIIEQVLLSDSFKKITIFNNSNEIIFAKRIINYLFTKTILDSPPIKLVNNKNIFLVLVRIFSYSSAENIFLLILKCFIVLQRLTSTANIPNENK